METERSMFDVGAPELVIILAAALILFGPKKLPEIGRSIGQTLREIRRASNDFMYTVKDSVVENDEEEKPADEKDGES